MTLNVAIDSVHPEQQQLAPNSSKLVQEITKHGSFVLKKAAMFDSPKAGHNGVEKCEPYDFLITTPLKLRYPTLTQFEHENLAKPFLVT